MKPKEYLALFKTLVLWGNTDETARHIIHDYIEALANDESKEIDKDAIDQT